MGFVSFQLVLSSLEVPGARAIVWIQNSIGPLMMRVS